MVAGTIVQGLHLQSMTGVILSSEVAVPDVAAHFKSEGYLGQTMQEVHAPKIASVTIEDNHDAVSEATASLNYGDSFS